MGGREGDVGQDTLIGLIEQAGGLGQLWPQSVTVGADRENGATGTRPFWRPLI
jgi:hypothetical protein